jgi:RNA polymerase sigma-70 factor (ECF subfamily)
VHGPRAALELVDALGLDGYHVLHAVRADLLRRLGRYAEALAAYDAAVALADSGAERAHLRRRRADLAAGERPGAPGPPGGHGPAGGRPDASGTADGPRRPPPHANGHE